ncbi:MAG: hypothetical protein ABH851_04585 [Methanobacteriota archaeon]
MVPVENNNNEMCKWRIGDKCINEKIAAGIIVNESTQSRWYCSNCQHFEEPMLATP